MHYRLLDYLRGFAAFWVLLFHYEFCTWIQANLPWFHNLAKQGDRAVPLFFVISGFCLAAAARGAIVREKSPGWFLTRRFWRIYPTFWCSIGAVLLLRLAMQALEIRQYGAPSAMQWQMPHYGWFEWLRVASLTQIFDQSKLLWWERFGQLNGVYWTLAIEFQFYVLVAAALIKPRWLYPVLFTLSLISLPIYLSQALFLKLACLGCALAFWSWFAGGILVYWLFEHGYTPQRLFGRRTRTVAAWGLIGIVAALGGFAVAGFQLERLTFAACSALALWLGIAFEAPLANLGQSRHWLAARTHQCLLLLGAMSYSFYLIHNEVSMALRRVALGSGLSAGPLADVLAIGGTVLVCFVFYTLCEAPVVKPQRRRRPALETGQESDSSPATTPAHVAA